MTEIYISQPIKFNMRNNEFQVHAIDSNVFEMFKELLPHFKHHKQGVTEWITSGDLTLFREHEE